MIAIPNADKPKRCIDCPVNDMVCELWTKVANIKARKHKDCPLIEIVRCGECKWYGVSDGMPYCDWWLREIEPDVFCSYGERRTDE